MSKNIVVLSGSPRKNGNTDRLVDAFIGGAKSQAKQVQLFRTATLKIGGCMGCCNCFTHPGECVQKDDMSTVLGALSQADALVFASPVYYFSVSAQLKLAIDRLFALYKKGMPIKRAALLMTCGDTSDTAAKSSISMFRQIVEHLKWDEAGIIVATNLHNPGEIDNREELTQARDLGVTI